MDRRIIKKETDNPIAITVFIVMVGLWGWLFYLKLFPIAVFVALIIISILVAASLRVADQWEKAVVLRMGKFSGLKGPGLFMIIPILDKIDKYIDQRVRVTDFKADQTLTKDTVVFPKHFVFLTLYTPWPPY